MNIDNMMPDILRENPGGMSAGPDGTGAGSSGVGAGPDAVPAGPWRIGDVELDSPFLLAPLAGVTDAPFRRLCRRYGAGAVVTEMISSRGLWHGDKATESLMRLYDDEQPAAIQIFGSEPEIMGEAAAMLRDRKNRFLDINMGCPVPKVVKNGDGSALLNNPGLLSKVVESVVLKAGKPVTVKIRAGWNEDCITAVENAKRIEAAGAAAITVHGRTRMQFYSGTADRDVIRRVKEAVKIPVIGNGDIFSVQSAWDMFEETGCDMVMIARGAMGNPWLFKSLKEGREYVPTDRERLQVLREHIESCVEEKGEYVGIRAMRKHVGWYLRGMHGAAGMRREINMLEDIDEVREALDRFEAHLR